MQLASRDICAEDGDVDVPQVRFRYGVEGIPNEWPRRMAQILLASEHTPEWESVVYLWLQVQNVWEKQGWKDGVRY